MIWKPYKKQDSEKNMSKDYYREWSYQDRRTHNLQAIEWQNRDLLKEISELREAMNQILILPVDNIDRVD